MGWKIFLLVGVFLMGSRGSVVNGPWLINRLNPFSRQNNPFKVPNGLSPVIFGETSIFAHKSKFKFVIAVNDSQILQFLVMAVAKSMQNWTNRAQCTSFAIKPRKIGLICGWTLSCWRHTSSTAGQTTPSSTTTTRPEPPATPLALRPESLVGERQTSSNGSIRRKL